MFTKYLMITVLFVLTTLEIHSQVFTPYYVMDISIQPKEAILKCTGTVTLPKIKVDIPAVILLLNERMHDLTILDSPNIKVEALDTVNGSVRWKIKNNTGGFKSGTTATIKFSYTGGEKPGFAFNLSEEACFAAGNNTEWFPQIENDPRSRGELRFRVPQGYIVTAPGKQLAKPGENKKGFFYFKIDHPSYFSFAVAKFIIYKKVYQKAGYSQTAFLLKQRPGITAVLDSCSFVNKVLAKEFGPNPYGNDFTLVEIPTELANKAQFDGASGEGSIWASSAFLNKPFNLAYYGHEMSHHWWGNAIGRNWWKSKNGRLMMDEGIAQYGSHRVVEVIEGKEEAKNYRLYGYPGYIDFHSASGYLMLNAGGFDQPLAFLNSNDKARILADSKGFIVYEMLAQYLGRAKFSKILQSITKKYSFKALTWETFLEEMETSAKKDLSIFYKQWLTITGAPSFSIKWQQVGNRITGTVFQDTANYNVALHVRGITRDGTIINLKIEIRGKATPFSFTSTIPIKNILIDPDYRILRWTEEFIQMRNAFGAFIQAFYMGQNGNFEGSKMLLVNALVKEPANEEYGSRFLLNMALGQINIFQGNFKDSKAYLEKALTTKTKFLYVLPWTYYYLARAAKETNDRELMKLSIKHAIEAEARVGKYIGAAQLAMELE